MCPCVWVCTHGGRCSWGPAEEAESIGAGIVSYLTWVPGPLSSSSLQEQSARLAIEAALQSPTLEHFCNPEEILCPITIHLFTPFLRVAKTLGLPRFAYSDPST